MGDLEDVLLDEELVPTLSPRSEEAIKFRRADPETSKCCCTGFDVSLVCMYFILCLFGLVLTFVPPELPLPTTLPVPDVVAAGLIHEAVGNKTLPLDTCARPYAQVCEHFVGDGLLYRRQLKLLDTLADILRNTGGLPEQLQIACESADQASVVLHTTVFEEWMQGRRASGLKIDAGDQPWYPDKPGRHLFVDTGTARRGPDALAPYSTLDLTGCPAARTVLQEFASIEPLVLPFLGRDIYTNNATATCEQFATVNVTAREARILPPLSEHTCAHTIGQLFPNHVASAFNRTLRDWSGLRKLFEHVQTRLRAQFKDNIRAASKLDAVQLMPWPTTYTPSLEGTPPSFAHGNWTTWLHDFNYAVWRAKLMIDATDPAPIMMPWEVNAFYSPDLNAVYVPPGLLTVFGPGDTGSAAFRSATITFIVAHELSHGLDPSSIHYAFDGQFEPLSAEALPRNYAAVIACLRRNAARRGIPPMQTLGESFADALGWHVLRHDRQGSTQALQTLGFPTNAAAAEALFVRVWCTAPLNLRGAHLNYSLSHDEHPPPNYRVDNTLASNAGADACPPLVPDALEPCMTMW